MANRVYTPPPSRRRAKPKPAKAFKPLTKKKRMKPVARPKNATGNWYVDVRLVEEWQETFPNVSDKLISATIHRERTWILSVMKKHLDDTTQIFDKFYTWASHEMNLIGKDSLTAVLSQDIKLYGFLQEYSKKRKAVQDKSAAS